MEEKVRKPHQSPRLFSRDTKMRKSWLWVWIWIPGVCLYSLTSMKPRISIDVSIRANTRSKRGDWRMIDGWFCDTWLVPSLHSMWTESWLMFLAKHTTSGAAFVLWMSYLRQQNKPRENKKNKKHYDLPAPIRNSLMIGCQRGLCCSEMVLRKSPSGLNQVLSKQRCVAPTLRWHCFSNPKKRQSSRQSCARATPLSSRHTSQCFSQDRSSKHGVKGNQEWHGMLSECRREPSCM